MADITQETCTDVIVRAMEKADEMEQVIVIYKLRDVDDDKSGVGWDTKQFTPLRPWGLMEMMKYGLLNRGQD